MDSLELRESSRRSRAESRGRLPELSETFAMKLFCELCGGKNHKILYEGNLEKLRLEDFNLDSKAGYGKHKRLIRCLDCGLVLVDLSEEVLDHYTNLKGADYQTEELGRSRYFDRVLREIQTLKEGGKLLDVGAATGIFLNEAEKKGFEIFGVEPSRWAVDYAVKNYKIDLFQGTLNEAQFPEKFFDVITLLDVIEHVSHPQQLLAEVRKILRDDGFLCLTTPNIGSGVAKILGERWWHVRPSHLYYFSDKTLNQLLEKTGFEIFEKRSYRWYFSLDYLFSRFFSEKNLPWRRLFKKLIVPINLGDSLEIYARKS